MQQLTLRGFSPELESHIRMLAARKNLSLNKAALLLLKRGAGLASEGQSAERTIGSSLDHLIGIWSEEDETEFKAATRGFDAIDPELWS